MSVAAPGTSIFADDARAVRDGVHTALPHGEVRVGPGGIAIGAEVVSTSARPPRPLRAGRRRGWRRPGQRAGGSHHRSQVRGRRPRPRRRAVAGANTARTVPCGSAPTVEHGLQGAQFSIDRWGPGREPSRTTTARRHLRPGALRAKKALTIRTHTGNAGQCQGPIVAETGFGEPTGRAGTVDSVWRGRSEAGRSASGRSTILRTRIGDRRAAAERPRSALGRACCRPRRSVIRVRSRTQSRRGGARLRSQA